jgi:hypothetical protein
MEKKVEGLVIAILIIGLVFLVMATMAMLLNKYSVVTTGDGTTSFQVYNQTWIECNSALGNYLVVPDYDSLTLSFWYNSSTSEEWQHVVNNTANIYTNGSLYTPAEYPVYYNGTAYFFCKTDDSTFWTGYIDDIRLYYISLNSTQINDTYNLGR